jgi:hypothetical protein
MVITTRVLGAWSALLVVTALSLGRNRPKGLVFHYCDVEGFFAASQGSKLVRSEKARDVFGVHVYCRGEECEEHGQVARREPMS